MFDYVTFTYVASWNNSFAKQCTLPSGFRGVLSGKYFHCGRLAPMLLAVSMLAAWQGWVSWEEMRNASIQEFCSLQPASRLSARNHLCRLVSRQRYRTDITHGSETSAGWIGNVRSVHHVGIGTWYWIRSAPSLVGGWITFSKHTTRGSLHTLLVGVWHTPHWSNSNRSATRKNMPWKTTKSINK